MRCPSARWRAHGGRGRGPSPPARAAAPGICCRPKHDSTPAAPPWVAASRDASAASTVTRDLPMYHTCHQAIRAKRSSSRKVHDAGRRQSVSQAQLTPPHANVAQVEVNVKPSLFLEGCRTPDRPPSGDGARRPPCLLPGRCRKSAAPAAPQRATPAPGLLAASRSQCHDLAQPMKATVATSHLDTSIWRQTRLAVSRGPVPTGRARTSSACRDEDAARRQVLCRQRQYCVPDPGLELRRELPALVHGAWRSVRHQPMITLVHGNLRLSLVIEMRDLGP